MIFILSMLTKTFSSATHWPGNTKLNESCTTVVFGLALIFCGWGCQPSAHEPENTPAFRLTITPVSGDSTIVEVKVTVDRDANWNALKSADNSDGSRYESVLSLHVTDDNSDIDKTRKKRPSQPAILGNYDVEGHTLRFRPEFPLVPGQRYVAHFDSKRLATSHASADSPIQTKYVVPNPSSENPPSVTAIYPSGSILPSNHLKFYLVFSEPMQQGNIFGYFRLQNLTSGQLVPRPFRHTELWSPDNLRLTLWFHPGRQKTGVNLNVDIGPILKQGNEYRLVISGDWPSEKGTPLGSDVEKVFHAGTSDHVQPKPQTWVLSSPRVKTRDTLRCGLGEQLDWALLHRRLSIEGPSGIRITGEIETGNAEQSWNFTPAEPWIGGTYRLVIDTVLEDLAGNSIERRFEVDVTNQPVKPADKPVSRSFNVIEDELEP